jgi:hypothetical protein
MGCPQEGQVAAHPLDTCLPHSGHWTNGMVASKQTDRLRKYATGYCFAGRHPAA